MPDRTALWAARLAGRERRLAEPPAPDLTTCVTELADDLMSLPDRPFVLLGHCFGAIIAFELARELQRRNVRGPERLLVVSAEPPILRTAARPLNDLSIELLELRKTDPEILARADLLRMLMPAIEADLMMSRSYVHVPGPSLAVPVDVLLSRAEWPRTAEYASWSLSTTGAVEIHHVDGDHLYPGGAWDELGAAVVNLLPASKR